MTDYFTVRPRPDSLDGERRFSVVRRNEDGAVVLGDYLSKAEALDLLAEAMTGDKLQPWGRP